MDSTDIISLSISVFMSLISIWILIRIFMRQKNLIETYSAKRNKLLIKIYKQFLKTPNREDKGKIINKFRDYIEKIKFPVSSLEPSRTYNLEVKNETNSKEINEKELTIKIDNKKYFLSTNCENYISLFDYNLMLIQIAILENELKKIKKRLTFLVG